MTCTSGRKYSFWYSWWWVVDTRNMSSSITENKSLHIAASCWTFIDIYMNFFTRNSPYYHLLKYLLFLLKHPAHILYLPTKDMSHIETQIRCYWITHLRECWVEGSSIRFYLDKTSAESTPIGSEVVKLHWRWTVSWRCLFSLALVNDELPFEMCHEFEVFLLLMCAHNFQFLSEQWLELLLKTVTKGTAHILLRHSVSYVCFTSTFPYKWTFIKKNSVM